MVMGRLLVGAWESGLTHADDTAAEMIVLSVQSLLKSIVTAVLLQRKHCRVSGTDGRFAYDIGRPMADPQLRASLVRRPAPVDDAPLDNVERSIGQDAMFFSACEQVAVRRPPRRVNLLDLYRTLSGDRQLVPAHSVLALNVERIAQRLH